MPYVSANEHLVILPSMFNISMGNQVVTSEIREEFHARFVKTQVKLFPNFTSIPFD